MEKVWKRELARSYIKNQAYRAYEHISDNTSGSTSPGNDSPDL